MQPQTCLELGIEHTYVMSRLKKLFTACFLFCWISLPGCDQSFNPKAPFKEKLVVFSLLSNDRNIQFVRVQTNYDVSGFDPSENSSDKAVLGASVIFTEAGNSFRLRDTLVRGSDSSRYAGLVHAYVASPYEIEYGKRYDLSVQSAQHGIVAGSVVVPDRPVISVAPGMLIFTDATQFGVDARFYLVANLSPLTKGYLGRVFLDYQVRLDSGWIDGRIEVPYHVIYDTLGVFLADYPKVTRAYTNLMSIGFRIVHYYKVKQKVIEKYLPHDVYFRRVVFRVMQLEQGFYDYFNAVNGFRDPHSIRVDAPEYSNVVGGIGLLGAYTLDSLTCVLTDYAKSSKR